METKRCAKCGRELPLSEFSKNNKKKDGLCCYCKSCTSNLRREYYENNKERLLEAKKIYCEANKERLIAYRKEYYKKRSDQRKKRYYKHKELGVIIPYGVYTKVCTCCGIEFTLDNFRKRINYKYGLDSLCKNCRSKKQKEYRDKHRDILSEIKKRYRISEKYKLCKKKYLNSDSYFKSKLKYRNSFPEEYITPELIAFKRAHIQLKREIKAQESQEPKNNN